MPKHKVLEARGHGKAMKGRKRTGTYQVIEPLPKGYLVKAQFRFTIADRGSREKAHLKANAKAKELG